MRNVAILVLLAAALTCPPLLHAQQQDPNKDGWQLHDPNEYQQEDSHPVRAIASLLSPIGWALEWGLARPWHYVATNTFLAPVLNGGEQDDTWSEYYGSSGQGSGQIAEAPVIPPVREAAPQPPLREQNLGATSITPQVGSSAAPNPPALGAPPYAPDQQGQAVLH